MPEKEITDEDLKNMSSEEIAELQKKNCIFCKISDKEIPAKIVHESKDNMCILDINPASEGHILVYPKKHYMIMPHMPDDMIAKLFQDVKLMSHTLLKSMQCKGTTIFIANGAAAGQRAPHVLIHVFPRRENDGLVKLPTYEMSNEQVDKLKRELKPYINQLFGKRSPIIKEAEFKDKIIPKEVIDEREEELEEQDDENTREEKEKSVKPNKKSSDTKKDDKKHDNKKDDDDKEEKKSSGKDKDSKGGVNLDDIARLFG